MIPFTKKIRLDTINLRRIESILWKGITGKVFDGVIRGNIAIDDDVYSQYVPGTAHMNSYEQ